MPDDSQDDYLADLRRALDENEVRRAQSQAALSVRHALKQGARERLAVTCPTALQNVARELRQRDIKADVDDQASREGRCSLRLHPDSLLAPDDGGGYGSIPPSPVRLTFKVDEDAKIATESGTPQGGPDFRSRVWASDESSEAIAGNEAAAFVAAILPYYYR